MSWIDELKVGDKVIVDIYCCGDMKLNIISKAITENGKLIYVKLLNDVNGYNYPRDTVEKCFFKNTEESILRGKQLKRCLKVRQWLASIELKDDTVLIDALYAVMEGEKKK